MKQNFMLKNLSENIRLLYIEDEEMVRNNTLKFLSPAFSHIDVAENGQIGLVRFLEKKHDLIVTDINMPVMDGISMISKIKKVAPEAYIIVTSCQDDQDSLITLIEMGIHHFIRKPYEIEHFYSVLRNACQMISNVKLDEAYKNRIEEVNKELEEKNRQLEKTVRIFETKLRQIKLPKSYKKQKKAIIKSIADKKTEEAKTTLIGDDLDEIKDLEADIDYIISKTILNHNILTDDISHLAEKLNKYSSILLLYPHFHLLAGGIRQLADAFQANAKTSQEKADFIFSYAESFIFVLMKWRSDVAEKQLADPHCYDASILSDIEQMIAYLEGRENEIGNDVDFF